jgi:hypothetical protein
VAPTGSTTRMRQTPVKLLLSHMAFSCRADDCGVGNVATSHQQVVVWPLAVLQALLARAALLAAVHVCV